MTLLALLVPILALALFAVLVVLLYRIWSKRQRSKAAQVLAT
jgi:type II secretory pathway component PulJ